MRTILLVQRSAVAYAYDVNRTCHGAHSMFQRNAIAHTSICRVSEATLNKEPLLAEMVHLDLAKNIFISIDATMRGMYVFVIENSHHIPEPPCTHPQMCLKSAHRTPS